MFRPGHRLLDWTGVIIGKLVKTYGVYNVGTSMRHRMPSAGPYEDQACTAESEGKDLVRGLYRSDVRAVWRPASGRHGYMPITVRTVWYRPCSVIASVAGIYGTTSLVYRIR